MEEVHAILTPVRNIIWRTGLAENCDPGAVEARIPEPWEA